MKIPSEESLVRIVEREGLSAVWLVPIIALIFGAWLVFDAVSQRGVFITVQFDNASGIVPGKTEVRYKGLTAGVVKDVEPSKDLQSVIVEIEMAANTKPYITDKASFWYVTADISLKGISDIDTLLSGSYINMEPDIKEEGESKRHFIALNEPPLLNKSIPGLHIALQTQRLGSLAKHSPVTFRQITVGYVSNYKYVADKKMVEVSAFIEPEYAHLVTENSRFWNASGIEVSASLAAGVKVRANSLASIVSGGIAFDHPSYEADTAAVQSGYNFPLYADYAAAQMGEEITLNLEWDSGLEVGAAIMFQGLTMGKISAFTSFDPQEKRITAKANINPRLSPYLTTDTEFYVVSPTLDLSGLGNVSTLFTGNYINVRPATSGDITSKFDVYNQAPAYSYLEPGLHLMLETDDVSSIRTGINLYFQQQVVGNVQAVAPNGPGQFLVHAHIKPEYQNYVTKDSRFWNVSGIKLSGNLQNFELAAQSVQSVLMGGIAFDNGIGNNEQPKNGDRFALYTNEALAKQRIEFELNLASIKGVTLNTRVLLRGEKIGSVHQVISRDGEHKLVVGILPKYQDILRENSQFWLVNPELSLSGATDTEALFGGRYINVNVGDGEPKTHFWAFNTPPAKPLSADGLQLILKAESGRVATPGSPISYRGIVVGQVDNVALDSSNQFVRVSLTIDESYRHLVTGLTRFYDASGVTVSGSIKDFSVKTDSFDAILRGGISFITPESDKKSLEIKEGDQFTLYKDIEAARAVGLAITIHFDDASGLTSNTDITYQDQVVGRVERLIFDQQGTGTKVLAYLNEQGERFAVQGSKFWLAKPEVGLVGSKNVSALLEGISIQVLPGSGAQKLAFIANNNEPVRQRLAYGLNIKLTAERLGSIRVGNPVLYRQVKVGKVIGVDLASNAEHVDIFINIDKRYTPLVTDQSKFWNVSGFKLDAGLFSGVNLNAESIETLLAGGIAFATPEAKADRQQLSSDAPFVLHDEPQAQWQTWHPAIKLEP
ncbi:MlaD family protein [Colwelliaceae bacterium 6471]